MASGKGFEGMVTTIAKGLGVAENAVRDVAYGKANGEGGIKFPGNKKKTNGLIPILREINKIDLCNIINYTLGNISLTDGVLGEKLTEIRKVAKELLDLLDGGLLPNSQAVTTKDTTALIGHLQKLDAQIDGDIVALFPKLQTYKNDIVNLIGVLIYYNAAVASYESLQTTDIQSQISSEEVQKVIKAVADIKQVLNVIISFTSLSDVASTLIPNEIQELQKIVNPTKLIPMIKVILALAKGFNQVVQQILGYVGIARTIVKVLQILITVMKIAIWVFRVLPMPLMFATSGIMDGLVWARQLLDAIVDNAEKIVGQIGKLIDIIFEFCTVISQILEEIIQQIEILLFTLESCLAIDEDGRTVGAYNMPSGLMQELRSAKGSLQYSLNQVNSLTESYRDALANSNKKVYNGYTMEIQEEEVFDQSVRYKRRRAVAFDYNGLLVEGTDLTFATDNTILFEELRLKLVNSGYIQDTGAFVPGLDFLADVLGTGNNTATLVNADTVAGRVNADLPTTNKDIYASIGINTIDGVDPQEMMKDEAAIIKKQINAVIANIKGGEDLRKSSQASVQQSNAKLKQNLKDGSTDVVSNPQITGGLAAAQDTVVNKGGTVNPDILSDAEVRRLQGIKKSVEDNPQSERLKNTQTYKIAVQKLEADAKARKEENMK